MSINGNTIYVLPCLQELKTSASYTLNEGEQQMYNLYGTSDKFDKYWSGTSKEDPDDIMTKSGLLNIPNCSAFGFNSTTTSDSNSNTISGRIEDNEDLSTTECKNFSRDKKWSIYAKFLADKCEEVKNNVALLVTHHNRMRDKDVDQGLIPFKEGSPYNGYANNCCLKISITKGKITDEGYSLFFSGFPDKGKFTCDNNDVVQKGGGDYKYFCSKDQEKFTDIIDTTLITKGINDANIDKTIDIDIYVIRHGNSLHNKPVEAWFGRLDSSLTPLGMYQAKVLGKEFEPILTNNINIILCTSFLQRAQLTGLLLLKNANIKFNDTMENGVEKLMYEAMKRYVDKKGKNVDIFKNYNPANEDFDVFNKYFNDEYDEYDEYEKYEAKTNEKINNSIEHFIDDDNGDGWNKYPIEGGKKRRQTKKQRVMKSKKVRRMKKLNKKSKKVKRRSNKRKA